MKNKLLILGGVIAVLLLGYSLWATSSQGKDDKNDGASQSTNDASEQVIRYTDQGFESKKYQLKANKPVKIVNQSSRTLEFSSDSHPTHKINAELNVAPLEPGKETEFTPSKTGTWGIHDHLRSSATTTLEVK